MNLYESALKRDEVLNDIAKDLSVLERDIAAARTSKAALGLPLSSEEIQKMVDAYLIGLAKVA